MSPSGFLSRVRARLHGGGGPQVGEVTRLSTLSLILIWSRLHYRWGNPPHVISPIWGPPPPCKQAIKLVFASEYNHLSTLPTTGDNWRMERCLHRLNLRVKDPIRGTQRQFKENICSEDDLRSRVFGTFVVKFLACLPLVGFSNIQKMV